MCYLANVDRGASDGPLLVIGRYELYHEIASGGMAAVHLGRIAGPAGFSRPVAIKRLHPHLARDPEFVAMFLDEARLAARIQHPNVVATLDVVASKGEVFLVMEYVQGETLRWLWKRSSDAGIRIDPAIVGAVMSNALHGLHAAHEATNERNQSLRIVHRDVSPQNIIVSTDGTARVLDFGVAKAIGRLQTTREGVVKGKFAYMAPEQFAGDAQLDRRVDVFAAGVVCWELLAGKRLFDGDRDAVVLARVMTETAPPLHDLAPDLPPSASDAVQKALAREPDDRFESARAFAVALEQSLGVAPPSVVGDWVKTWAATSIEKRAEELRQIEKSVSTYRDSVVASVLGGARIPSTHPVEHRAPVATNDTPDTAVANTTTTHDSDSRRRPLVFAVIALVLAVIASLIAVPRLTRVEEPAVASSYLHLSRGSVASVDAAVRIDSGATASDAAAAGAASSAAASARPPVRSTGARPTPPRNDCNPPFTIDSNGYKTRKRDCLK